MKLKENTINNMKKRSLVFILFSLFSLCLFAQEKDRRAELDYNGRINEISISPDERIFIVTNRGKIYCAENIYSSFKTINHLFYSIDSIDDYNSEYPNLDRISFFNNDTAVITGYIQSSKKGYSSQNGYYYTTNGLKNIKRLCFGKKENEWIYDVFIISDGNAWMGGSQGNIFYSSNYGKTWKKLNSPLLKEYRTTSIFMSNLNIGIVGGTSNNLYVTNDNWKNYTKIETPFDQNLFTGKEQISYMEIIKIRIWKDYYVVKQYNKVFYSKIDKIEWKEFNVNLVDFEIDRDSNNLFTITKENHIIQFEDIDSYKTIYFQEIKGRIVDMKVVNNSVYLSMSNFPLNNENRIAKINTNEFFQTYLFTNEKKIEVNNKIINGNKLQWTFNENYVYITEKDKQDWYREAQLEYTIKDLLLLNDSTAILWNGKDNYLYSTSTKKDFLYYPQNPLSSFLNYSINKIEIKEGGAGDGYYRSYLAYYYLTDSMLTITTLIKENENYIVDFSDSILFNNQVNLKDVTEILQQFNNNSQQLPLLKDFNITEMDKKEYILLLDSLFNSKYSNDYKKFKKDTSFFYNINEIIDTISNETFTAFITRDRDTWSTSRRWFEINFINSNNDTIQIFNYWYRANAFYFPLTIKYKEQYINSSNLPLSLLIKKLYPFTDKFENKKLLLDIVTYLNSKRKYYQ